MDIEEEEEALITRVFKHETEKWFYILVDFEYYLYVCSFSHLLAFLGQCLPLLVYI